MKSLFLSRSEQESESTSEAGSGIEALTPVIGSLMLLLITLALAGTIAAVFNLSDDEAVFQTSMAKITLESCEGGLYVFGPEAERARLEENQIVLLHEGGSPLLLDTVSINIFGYGNSYHGLPGHEGKILKGNISIFYHDLSSRGKNPKYLARNGAVLENGLWEAGEKLILYGNDSSVGSIDSSVKVSVDGVNNTSDNYGFQTGSKIALKVIDREGKCVLSEQEAVVMHSDTDI